MSKYGDNVSPSLTVCVKVMLKAAPIFLNAFYRLVASIIKEGRQKGESDRGGTDKH